MLNLAKQEKLIIIFLSSTALIGLGLNYHKKVARQVELKVIPSSAEREDEALDNIIERARKININSSGMEELVRLPGIGPNLAQGIVDYRNKAGFFHRVEDIQKVSGIGPKKFEQIKEFLLIE